MKVMEKNVMRLVAVQHLRTAYGIKTKNWNKNRATSCKSTASNSVSKEKQIPLKLAFNFSDSETLESTICYGRPWINSLGRAIV